MSLPRSRSTTVIRQRPGGSTALDPLATPPATSSLTVFAPMRSMATQRTQPCARKTTPTRRFCTVTFSERISGSTTVGLGRGVRLRSERVLDPAEQVAEEERLRVRLGRVAVLRVPGAAAVELVLPGDRMVGAHRPVARLVGALVDREQDADAVRARAREPAVPLVGARPARRQRRRRGVTSA